MAVFPPLVADDTTHGIWVKNKTSNKGLRVAVSVGLTAVDLSLTRRVATPLHIQYRMCRLRCKDFIFSVSLDFTIMVG